MTHLGYSVPSSLAEQMTDMLKAEIDRREPNFKASGAKAE